MQYANSSQIFYRGLECLHFVKHSLHLVSHSQLFSMAFCEREEFHIISSLLSLANIRAEILSRIFTHTHTRTDNWLYKLISIQRGSSWSEKGVQENAREFYLFHIFPFLLERYYWCRTETYRSETGEQPC